MNVGFEGIGRTVATFACKAGEEDTLPAVGDVVTLSASGEVKKSAAKEHFAGVCVSRNGGYAGVQIRGAITLPYTGDSAPTVGYNGFTAGSGLEGEITPERLHEIVQTEIGLVFKEVLTDAGVYKCTEEGRAAFMRFVDTVNA